MNSEIQTLIEQRPHLRDPLERYARWSHFSQSVQELLSGVQSIRSEGDARSYPGDLADAVFDLFLDVLGVSAEQLAPLRAALARGDLDFLRFPLDDYPVVPGLSWSPEEASAVLFLLSRPHFQALRQRSPQDGGAWVGGRCPLCSAQPVLASIVEGPQRRLHCSFCATTGTFRFIGCPHCGNNDVERLGTIVSDDEPGFRIATCDECHSYLKTIESSVLQKMSVDLADMASLPLDMVAQDKGYVRLAPNPIGLQKMR